MGRDSARGGPGTAWLFSAAIHAAVLMAVLIYAVFVPKPPATVAVFELVRAERPKIRPLAPKTPEPPPEKTPQPSRPPEAPQPVAKPKLPAPPKPEPKVARPAPPDTALPVRDVPQETSVPKSALVAPSDPRLSMWARRVQKQVESRWNPPAGIDVKGRAKTVVSFAVARTGTIEAVEVSAGSGNAFLDDQAKLTIKRLERVPPLPESFPGDLLKVSYEFIYNGD